MKIDDFDFQLPEELIAEYPLKNRDESRLLVVHRQNHSIEECQFKDLIHFLDEKDCLILNETQVYPARLYGVSNSTHKKREFVLVKYLNNNNWKVLINRSKQCRVGDRYYFQNEIVGEIQQKLENGLHVVCFNKILTCEILNSIGEMALPPYIHKLRNHEESDRDNYQTVYHKNIYPEEVPVKASIAAPTAGLHFTKELINTLKKKG